MHNIPQTPDRAIGSPPWLCLLTHTDLKLLPIVVVTSITGQPTTVSAFLQSSYGYEASWAWWAVLILVSLAPVPAACIKLHVNCKP